MNPEVLQDLFNCSPVAVGLVEVFLVVVLSDEVADVVPECRITHLLLPFFKSENSKGEKKISSGEATIWETQKMKSSSSPCFVSWVLIFSCFVLPCFSLLRFACRGDCVALYCFAPVALFRSVLFCFVSTTFSWSFCFVSICHVLFCSDFVLLQFLFCFVSNKFAFVLLYYWYNIDLIINIADHVFVVQIDVIVIADRVIVGQIDDVVIADLFTVA